MYSNKNYNWFSYFDFLLYLVCFLKIYLPYLRIATLKIKHYFQHP